MNRKRGEDSGEWRYQERLGSVPPLEFRDGIPVCATNYVIWLRLYVRWEECSEGGRGPAPKPPSRESARWEAGLIPWQARLVDYGERPEMDRVAQELSVAG